ncbi:DUF4307 domain-containing protein [Glutamicibacter nicotianae]|uniref:DUF4307 domain-containing protein n=1 Tax=Glutamicibacter nicotianae TaxID=37929 RepID=UPI00195A1D98|nr:DUF4307 domain-containing protein [Glutamicibacter nicotianae]MBM7767598.1 hypothetical protein [Glutamicibacter nicotianae]
MSDPSLTARYNNPKKRSLPKKTRNWLIAAALSLGVAGAAYFGFSNYTAIKAQDIEFEVVSATQAKAIVAVEYNAKYRVQCDIRAMNESKAIVGYETVLLDPGEATGHITQRLDVDLHTDNLATTVGVESCYEVPQEYKG